MEVDVQKHSRWLGLFGIAAAGMAFGLPAQAATTLSVYGGNNQTAQRTGTAVAGGVAKFAPLQVLATDSSTGKPVSGVQVSFACAAPHAFDCQMNSSGFGGVSVPTDASGIATLAGMAGSSVAVQHAVGPVVVNATSQGANTVAFNLTVTDPAGSAQTGAGLTIISGDGQTVARTTTSSGLAQANFAPLVVKLQSASGAPISGATVSFNCVAASPMMCALNGAGGKTVNVVTDSTGTATLNQLSGNAVAVAYGDGSFTVTATSQAANAVFHLTVASSAAPLARHMSVLSGDDQMVKKSGNAVPGGMAIFGPLSVVVKDNAGRPVPGVKVGFQCVAPAGMACQLSPLGPGGVSTQTDSSGVATLNQLGGNSVHAYNGAGTFRVIANGDGTNPVTFSLTAQDSAPTATTAAGVLSILSGNNQRVARVKSASGLGVASFAPLAVRLIGPTGKPLSNVAVSFKCSTPANMSCQTEPTGPWASTVTTDGNGNAVLNHMQGFGVAASGAAGGLTVTATYGSTSQTFTLTVTQ